MFFLNFFAFVFILLSSNLFSGFVKNEAKSNSSDLEIFDFEYDRKWSPIAKHREQFGEKNLFVALQPFYEPTLVCDPRAYSEYCFILQRHQEKGFKTRGFSEFLSCLTFLKPFLCVGFKVSDSSEDKSIVYCLDQSGYSIVEHDYSPISKCWHFSNNYTDQACQAYIAPYVYRGVEDFNEWGSLPVFYDDNLMLNFLFLFGDDFTDEALEVIKDEILRLCKELKNNGLEVEDAVKSVCSKYLRFEDFDFGYQIYYPGESAFNDFSEKNDDDSFFINVVNIIVYQKSLEN